MQPPEQARKATARLVSSSFCISDPHECSADKRSRERQFRRFQGCCHVEKSCHDWRLDSSESVQPGPRRTSSMSAFALPGVERRFQSTSATERFADGANHNAQMTRKGTL